MFPRMRSCPFGLALALVALLAGALPAAAQSPSWDTLKQLTAGQQIRVLLSDSKSYKGQFQALTEDAIVIHSKGADQTLPRESVKLISSRRPSHRGRHALIGAGIGAVVGLSIGGPVSSGCFCTANEVRAVATPLFGVLGAGIGAALPSGGWQELYRISNKIVRTMNVTQSAVGDKRGLWTTVLGAAILIGEDD